ncbi:NUDIX hydrolase [Pseudomonas luteola]|uniref:NUDIX hydrolase n=1 Tax=Pseudomonas luteola TaxID=47886 RepID=UPI001239E80B|nr:MULTISPECIES: NUDIX domain-containing protein [Pseudomonas]MBA1247769.1 NUDIX domain-containing protein [Pseudomonas zeshuii]QEU29286.1 NUDIX domain-containing protein [Pseudomonas luteola]
MPITRLKIAAACLLNPANELLVVRKRHTRFFMLPGGKLEAGESGLEALAREIQEELNLLLDTETYQPLGLFQAPAANEPDTMIEAELFMAYVDTPSLAVAAELEELAWIPLTPPYEVALAPLLSEHVLPLLQRNTGLSPANRQA